MNNDNKYYTVSNEKVKPSPLYLQKLNELNTVFSATYLQPYKIEINENLKKMIEDTRKIIMEDFLKIIEKILRYKNQGHINNLKDNKINTLITNLKLIRNFEDPDYDIIPKTIRSEMNGAQESDDPYEMVKAKGRENSVLAIQKNIVNLSNFFLDVLVETGIDNKKSYAETGGRGKKRKYSTQKKNKSKRRRRTFSKKAYKKMK